RLDATRVTWSRPSSWMSCRTACPCASSSLRFGETLMRHNCLVIVLMGSLIRKPAGRASRTTRDSRRQRPFAIAPGNPAIAGLLALGQPIVQGLRVVAAHHAAQLGQFAAELINRAERAFPVRPEDVGPHARV